MDRSREHTAAFTGHRRYDGECDDALRAVVRELYGRGFRVFWSGMALGFDLAAAEAVLALRGELPVKAVFHSDRGTQYTSAQITLFAANNGITRSMGYTGIFGTTRWRDRPSPP